MRTEVTTSAFQTWSCSVILYEFGGLRDDAGVGGVAGRGLGASEAIPGATTRVHSWPSLSLAAETPPRHTQV